MSTKQAQPPAQTAPATTAAVEADPHKASEANNLKSKPIQQQHQQRPPYKRTFNNDHHNKHPRQGPRPPYASGPPPAVVAKITSSEIFKEYRELAPSEVTNEEIMRVMRDFRNDPEKVKMHLISLYEKDAQGNRPATSNAMGYRGNRKPRDPNNDWKLVGKAKKNAPTKPGASRAQDKQKGAPQGGKNAQKISKSHHDDGDEDDDEEDDDEDSDDDSDAADNNVDKTKNAAAAWNGRAIIDKVKKEKESAAKLSVQQNPPLPKKSAPAGPASSQQPSYAKASAPKPNEAHDQGGVKPSSEQANQNNQQQAPAQPEGTTSSQTTAPVEQKPPAQPVVKAPSKPNYADILKGKKEKQTAEKKPVKPPASAKENQAAEQQQSKSTPVDTAAITNQASNLSINDESSKATTQQESPTFAENVPVEQSTSENAESSPVGLVSDDNISNAAEKAQVNEPVPIEQPAAAEQIETVPHPIKQQAVVEPTPIENEKVVADNEIKSSIKDYPQHQVEQPAYIPPIQAQPQVQAPQPVQPVQQIPQQVQQPAQPAQQIPQQQNISQQPPQQQAYTQYHQMPYQAQMHHDSPQGIDDSPSGPNDDLQNTQGASQQHGGYDSNMAHLSGYGMQSQGQQGYGQGAYGGANNSVKRKATRGRGKTNTYDSVNAPYFQDGPSPYMYPNTTGYNDASNLYPPNYYQPGTMAHNAIPSNTVGMNQMQQQPPSQFMQHTTSQMPGMGSQQHMPFQQQAQPDSQSYFGAMGSQAQVGVASQDSVYRQQPVYVQPSQQGNTQSIPQQPTTHSHYGMTPAQQQQQQQNYPYPYGYYPYAYPAPAPHYPTFQQQAMGMGMGVNQMGSMAPAGVKSPPPGYVQNPTSIPPSVPSQAYGNPHATYMPQNWTQYYTNQQYGMQLSPAQQQQQQGPLPGNGNEPAPYGQQGSTWRPNQ